MSNKNARENISDKESFLRSLGCSLVIFLCAFVAFRSPLAELTTSAIKIIPDLSILAFFVIYSISIRFRYRFKAYDLLFLGFLAVAFASTVIVNRAGPHHGLSNFVFQVRSISVYYLLVFTLRNLKLGKKEFCRIVTAMQWICYVLLALGVVEKVCNKEYLFPQSVANSIIYADNFARVYSMFFNPNTYGAFTALTLLLSVAKPLYFGERNSLAAYIALGLSLLLSMSRSSILIAVPMLLICLFLAWRKSRVSGKYPGAFSWKAFFRGIFSAKGGASGFSWKAIGASLLLVLVVTIGAYTLIQEVNKAYTKASLSSELAQKPNMDPLQEIIIERKENASEIGTVDRFQEISTDEIFQRSNTNGRIFAVKTGIQIFSDHPVWGTGFGTYGSAASLHTEPETYKEYGVPFPFYADNQYICVFTETGLVGTLMFCVFLLSGLLAYRKNSFKMLLCITVAWLGLFYNVFEVQAITVVFWSSLAFDDTAFAPIGSVRKQKAAAMKGQSHETN